MLIRLLARVILVPLIFLGCVPMTPDMRHGETEESPLEAAVIGRDDLRTLKTPEDDDYAKGLGFASVQEAMGAELGSPLRIYRVDAFLLKDFRRGTDPNLLLMDAHTLIFPLNIDGQPRASLMVTELNLDQNQKERWRITKKGFPKLAQMIGQSRTSSSNMLIEISGAPSEMRFLAYQKLMLIPLTDNPKLELKAGEEIPAETVFEKLAPHATDAYTAPYTRIRKKPGKTLP